MATPGGDDFFLPDFCTARSVAAVMVVAQLVVFLLILARPAAADPWLDLLRMTLFLQWIALVSAAALCLARGWLAALPVPRAALAAFGLLVLTASAMAEAAWQTAHWLRIGTELVPVDHADFLFRTVGLSAIVGAAVLRYLYVQHQWKLRIKTEAGSRFAALQARIRPHFLFNSMNTIAALTRTDAQAAETAVEDLSDLFRASLVDASQWVTLREELELCRRYVRIEAQRLGARLKVEWYTGALPPDARVPALTLQPLLENAIYHGVEPSPDGGTVTVSGRVRDERVEIEIANPVPRAAALRDGHSLALDNVAERLQLAFPGEGRLETAGGDGRFVARLVFPHVDADAPADR